MPKAVLFALFPSLGLLAAAQGPGPAEPVPARLTAQQDHKLMMEALKIRSLREGANGMNPKAPNAANYDEAKANPYPNLPDPLTLRNGEKVKTAEAWWSKRRPEIVEDFDREVYGRVPKDVPKVTWEAAGTTEEKVGGVAVLTKRLMGHVDNSKCPQIKVYIQLTLTTPADAKGPVPVMMEFGFGGFGPRPGGTPGKAATPKANEPLTKARMPGFGGGGPSWQEQVIAKGWGYAIIVPNSIQADNGAGLTRGIIGLCNRGRPRKPDDWGALRAWAWGASRALDYFETDKSVDARQVGIEGLSRYGKAALVAMAYDPRFAIGFIGSSGEGGAKLHRRNFGELVENLTGSGEYHWMAGNFLRYGGPLAPGDLPVDAHELIALCAPRPTFISYGASSGPGAEGQWVDQRGSFMAAVAAGPVYRLLGKRDLGTSEFPEVEHGLTDGELAFRQHKGGHTTGPNWPTFLKFADSYIKLAHASAEPASHAEGGPVELNDNGAWASCVADFARYGQHTVIAAYQEVETGKRADRSELAKAIAHTKRAKSTLVIAKLDRLARNVHFLSGLMESRIDFVCCDNPHANRLTLHILAAVAQDEARRISERIKAALAAYKARGGKLGTPANLTAAAAARGSEVTRARARIAYVAVLPELRQWRAAGLSYREIAAMLNGGGYTTRTGAPWNHNQVKRVLSRGCV
jgi:DNA invertase Pin-like site-specific DNA recombinase